MEVRYFILCDDVQANTNDLHRLNVFGILAQIRSTSSPPFPVTQTEFSVLLILTNCMGTEEISIRIVESGTGRVIFRNRPRRFRFVGMPQDFRGVRFRIQNCTFPRPGLYWVECIVSGFVIERKGLNLIG
jgi:hypothetical protein